MVRGSNGALKDSAASAANNRGAAAPLTPSSAAASRETTTTITMMTMRIASPATIKLMGATVLVPKHREGYILS